jgi:hypothetical protein
VSAHVFNAGKRTHAVHDYGQVREPAPERAFFASARVTVEINPHRAGWPAEYNCVTYGPSPEEACSRLAAAIRRRTWAEYQQHVRDGYVR